MDVNSFPISGGAKALRPDLVALDAGGNEETCDSFNE